MIIGLLKDAILSKSNATGFLIDGFPRQLDQGEMFEREVGKGSVTPWSLPSSTVSQKWPNVIETNEFFDLQVGECDMVLVFDCSEEVMAERLLQRGLTSGRTDDNEDTIRKRLVTFREATLPVIEHYHSLGKVKKVSR